MNDTLVTDLSLTALMLVAGGLCGLLNPKQFSWRWLLYAGGLVLAYNFLLSNGYGLLPNFLGGSWNWQGMALAFIGMLAFALLPGLGWKQSGLTLAQTPGSLRWAIPVALVYCLYPIAIRFAFGGSDPTPEAIAFQATLPGMTEETFYRGVLLLALDQSLRGRVRFAGVEWGFGAVLSCALFGAVHAFGYGDGKFSFDTLTFLLTGVPAFVAVWLRYRTGSVLLPIIVHNFGNSFQMTFR